MGKTSARSPTTAPSLARYQEKRDFSQTAEPSGRLSVAPSNRLRFVIQKHAASHLHYDLRLECNGVFKSWAVTKGPSVDPADKRFAVEVEDHPLDYGDFEGTIARGQYGGGTVQLWDRGYWTPEGSESGELKFILEGKRLGGSWVLVRLKGDRFGGKRLEGIVSKRLDASYASGRSGVWTKAKCRAGHEVVLGGWSTEGGGLRSLLAGVNRDGRLVYVGRIGTGYSADVVGKLLPTLEQLTRDRSPFGGENAPVKEKNIRWLDCNGNDPAGLVQRVTPR